MRIFILLGLLVMTSFSYAQKEGQTFCEAYAEDSYFPLSITVKKILWQNTYYSEKNVGTKIKKGKEYIEYAQNWKSGNTEYLYLREENGIVYQYEECCETETVRFDPSFKEGHTWKTADNLSSYTIETRNGNLDTPFCNYKNLVVISFKADAFACKFYYKKGYGYIGATMEETLISCATPTFKIKS